MASQEQWDGSSLSMEAPSPTYDPQPSVELFAALGELKMLVLDVKRKQDEQVPCELPPRCDICLTHRVDAVLKECGHVACRSCLNTIGSSTSPVCPRCRVLFTPADILNIYF